eukprot:TRINITY_DN409_c0_g2_i1.p2 TRINITY_DN409_c0_g2~~TRINITY_DN409_c0_g2_i1.p2  ORF type:complete len:171 (-),score=68.34 TRINITY_DN409_c0_g2_i1:78-590(-)
MPKTYLIAYDGSSHAKETLQYIADFARDGSKVILFGAYDPVQPVQPVSVPGAFYVPPANTDWVHKEKERRAKVAAHVLLKGKDDLLALEGNVVKADDIREIVVETFDVRDAIIELAEIEKVDAIVCGSRGHGAVKRFVLGSTSSYLAHHANVPVIICRAHNDVPEGEKAE